MCISIPASTRNSSPCSMVIHFKSFSHKLSDFFSLIFKQNTSKDHSPKQELRNRVIAFPAAAKQLIEEITEKEAFASGPSATTLEASGLADRIEKLASPLILRAEQVHEKIQISNETLIAAYELGLQLKKTTPLSMEIWKRLCPKVQKLFNTLLPYFEVNADQKPLQFSTAKVLPEGSFYLSFTDNRLFRVKVRETGTGTVGFELPDAPNVTLRGIQKAPFATYDMINDYVKYMPATIYEVFDVKALENELEEYCSLPSIHREISLQIKHQMLVLKTEYMKQLLESLGVPVDKAAMLSSLGEWSLKPNKEVSSLTKENIEKLSGETVKVIAENIRIYFELERKFGIAFLGENLKTVNPKTLFVFSKEGEVYQKMPQKKLKFIEGSIEDRHTELQRLFKKELPENLHRLIFSRPFSRPFVSEKAIGVFAAIMDKGYLSAQDIFSQTEEAHEILRSLGQNSLLLDQENSIPWEKLDTIERLISYLHFCETIQNPPSKAATVEDICAIASELISSIPSGMNPYPSQSEFLTALPSIVERDFELRKKASRKVFEFLLECFLQTPDIPLEERYNSLIESVNQKLKIKIANKELHIPVLREQRIFEDRSEYIFEKESGELDPFIYPVLWLPILEELNARLFPEPEDATIEESIALLRGAYFSSDKIKEEESDPLTEHLFLLLHNHMLKENEKALVRKLRDRIKRFKSENSETAA